MSPITTNMTNNMTKVEMRDGRIEITGGYVNDCELIVNGGRVDLTSWCQKVVVTLEAGKVAKIEALGHMGRSNLISGTQGRGE